MARWEPDGYDRLQASAFELFAERGFEMTTVAEIAARAGLTERTFFNHFADKREVLFARNSEFQNSVVEGIAASDAVSHPLDSVVFALRCATEMTFEEHRDEVRRREQIVQANPHLRERDLAKRGAVTDAIIEALGNSGVGPEAAAVVASVGMLVHQTAIRRWMEPDEVRPIGALLADELDLLRSTVSAGPD